MPKGRRFADLLGSERKEVFSKLLVAVHSGVSFNRRGCVRMVAVPGNITGARTWPRLFAAPFGADLVRV